MLSIKTGMGKIIIITKIERFCLIDIKNNNIPTFIINNEYSIIESMIVKNLSYKGIRDIKN